MPLTATLSTNWYRIMPTQTPNPTPAPELIKVFCDLITERLGLKPDRVVIYNQKWNIPNDVGLFVVVGFLNQKPFGNNLGYANRAATPDTPEGLNQVQSQNVQENYWIEVFSRNSEARTRQFEISFALASTQAQQISEKYSFRLAGIPLVFNDLSFLEGAAIINRYHAEFSAMRAYSLVTDAPYFDKFTPVNGNVFVNP